MLWLEILNTGDGTSEVANYNVALRVTTASKKIRTLHETMVTDYERSKGAVELLKIAVDIIEYEMREK